MFHSFVSRRLGGWQRSNREYCLPILLGSILLFAVFVTPYFSCGPVMDDALHAYLKAFLKHHGMSFFDFAILAVKNWANSGRFFPFSQFVILAYWAFLGDFVVLRVIEIGLWLLNLIQCFLIFRLIGVRRDIAILAVIITTIGFQVRFWDGVLSCALVTQMTLTFGLASVHFLLIFQKLDKVLFRNLSAICYLSSLLFYEPGLIFLPVLIGLVFLDGKSERIRTTVLYFGVTGLYLISVLFIKGTAGIPYAGTKIGSISRFLRPYLVQTFASFPLSHFFQAGIEAFRSSSRYWFSHIDSWFVFLSCTGIVFAILQMKNDRVDEKLRPSLTLKKMIILAFPLFLLPAVFIAISERYQGSIVTFGQSYIVVYFIHFGFGALAALLLIGLKDIKNLTYRSICLVACALVIGMMAAMDFSHNKLAVAELNEEWVAPRKVFSEALEHKLGESIPSKANVLVNFDKSWVLDDLFFGYNDQIKTVTRYSDFVADSVRRRVISNNGGGLFFIDFIYQNKDLGGLILSEVQRIIDEKSQGQVRIELSDEFKLLLRGKKLHEISTEKVNVVENIDIEKVDDKWSLAKVRMKRRMEMSEIHNILRAMLDA